MPRAAENLTLKDGGKMEFWAKRSNSGRGGTKKIVLVLMDETKYTPKIMFNPQKVKKGGQNGDTYVSPNIEGEPSPGYRDILGIIWAPSQYKDRLISVWRFLC